MDTWCAFVVKQIGIPRQNQSFCSPVSRVLTLGPIRCEGVRMNRKIELVDLTKDDEKEYVENQPGLPKHGAYRAQEHKSTRCHFYPAHYQLRTVLCVLRGI